MSQALLVREFISTVRSPRSLILLFGPAVLLSALVILRWPVEGVVTQFGARSLEVFQIFGYGALACVCLVCPITPAVSFVKERIHGTLVLLLNTPLSPWQIYLGKLLGVTAFIFLPLLMTCPAAAACYALGGITITGQVLPLYGVLALATLQITALSLLVSSRSKNLDSAVRVAYSLMLALTVGTLAPYQLLQGSSLELATKLSFWIRQLSPVSAVMDVLNQGDIGGMGLVTTSNSLWYYGLMGTASTLVFALATIPRLNLRIFDEARDSGVMTDDRNRSQRWLRRILFLVDPQRRSGFIGNWTNPVLIKEFRSRRFGRLTWLLRLVAICAVASMGLTYFAATSVESWSVETIGSLLIVLQMALIVLLSPGLSAGLLASELETGGWTMLRMTPLSSLRIMTGKLFSVAWTMLLILLATLPGYVVMIYVKPILQQQILFVVASLVFASVFTLIVSAAVGSLFRRTTPATMTSYAVLTTLTGLPLLIWLGREAPFGFRVVQTALFFDPIASALSYMQPKTFNQYQLLPGNWYFLGAGCVVGLLVFWFRCWRLMRPD